MSSYLLDELRTTTRQALAAGRSEDVVDQLDLGGLLVDGDAGGLGLGEREMLLVAEEIGRSTSASAFLPMVVLAATLLSGGELDADLSATLAVNRYAVALAKADGSWSADGSAVTAVASGEHDWVLSGSAWGLTTPEAATAVLTVATTDHGRLLVVTDVVGATLTLANEFDPGRGFVEVNFDRTPARQVVPPTAVAETLAVAYRRMLLAVAAEQLGVARAALDLAVEYAKTREQFGASIGSFQAIKHRCADMLLDAELADAVLLQAVGSSSSSSSSSLADAELAYIVASRAAVSAAESCIHIHGGIGFTWDHSAHWYLRRARVNATLLGPPDFHRLAIAISAGLATGEGE